MGQAAAVGLAIANRHFLVTGGAGFIGTHLCRALRAAGARVTAIDSGKYAHAGAEVVRFTLGTDPIASSPRLGGRRRLFHLAAEKHNQSLATPERCLRANVDGTYLLFAAAARAGVKKVVFSSSLYAYGRVARRADREDELPRAGDPLRHLQARAASTSPATRAARAAAERRCATSSSTARASFRAWATSR